MSPRASLPSCDRAAVLVVLAVLVHRSVLADQLCDTMQYGNETQFALNRGVLRVDPGLFTLEISEPHVCSVSEAVGLKVTACDEGHAPRVLLLDATHGVVVRAASPTHAATVYVTMYCATDSDGAALEPADSPVEAQPYLGEASLQSSSVSLPATVSTPESLPLLEVGPPSSTNDNSVPVMLESRFSSLDHLNGPSKPTSLLSRIKYLWQDHAAPSLGQFKSHSSPNGTSSNYRELGNPTSSLTDTSSSSLAKRLIDLQPKRPPKLLDDRSPKWKQRPTRRPSSPWLKLRSLLDRETRKSMSRSLNSITRRFPDYNDPWTPYEDDPLSLHWTDEPTDSNSWYTEGEPQSPYKSSFPWQNEGPNRLLNHERKSKSSIKHDSKKQTRYVPPIHEEDPALLLEWKKDRPASQAPLPKLLLLLQDHPAPNERKCSSEHSVEDSEPWWLDKPNKEIGNEGIPWQPDYLTDYTADDGDAYSYLQGPSTDDKKPHRAVHNKEPYALQRPPSGHQIPASEKYLYYSPSPLTERPLLTSTVHNSLSWIKSSNAAPQKLPMMIKRPIWKKLLEPKDNNNWSNPNNMPEPGDISHDIAWAVPPKQRYPPDNHYQSKFTPPVEPKDNNNWSDPNNTPDHHHRYAASYDVGRAIPPEQRHPPDNRYPSKFTPPVETYIPSKLNLPSRPSFPSEANLPSDSRHPPEPYYPSEPYYPTDSQYPPDPYYSSDYPAEPDYPSGPFLPSKPTEHHYPSTPHQPSKPHLPSKPRLLPSVPSKLHNWSMPQYPSERHYPPENHHSSPWNFLSELLLSHPTFRDSTHVIRIR